MKVTEKTHIHLFELGEHFVKPPQELDDMICSLEKEASEECAR